MSGNLARLVSNGDNATIEQVDVLLRGGADLDGVFSRWPSTIDSYSTALGWAAMHGNESLVLHLLKCGATIENGRTNGQSPLSLAAHHGRVGAVHALLAAGANVDIADGLGRTPLLFALFKEHNAFAAVAIVTALLRAGADVSRADKLGRTALHVAAARDSACVRMLLARGANVDALDAHGRTPLQLAVESNDVASAHWLLAAGATVDTYCCTRPSPRALVRWRNCCSTPVPICRRPHGRMARRHLCWHNSTALIMSNDCC